MLNHPSLSLLDSQWFQVNTKVLFVISFCEVITIIDNTISAKYVNLSPNTKVSWRVELLSGHIHSWVACLNWLFGKLLFFKKEWE